MDVYNDEILKLWKTLNRFNVAYIMIGGFAINLHGYNRSTDDIDIWINDSIENRYRLGQAFEQLQIAPGDIVNTMQFVPGWTNFSLLNGFKLDVMSTVKGLVSFDDCLAMAVKMEIDNVIVPFLHLNHLITAKKATNRPKDQLDIIELEKIREYQNRFGNQPDENR